MKPVFFESGAEFRSWLEKNAASSTELLVAFHKTKAGQKTLTYPEARDEALCFGWIDGVRTGRDENTYTIRFTPRKARSTWSRVNLERVAELSKQGRMTPAGLAAFAARKNERTGIYSYESKERSLSAEYEALFRADAAAWEFFSSQAPSYRRTACFLVMNAKKEETRLKRLSTLIEDSRHHRRLRALSSWQPKPKNKKS